MDRQGACPLRVLQPTRVRRASVRPLAPREDRRPVTGSIQEAAWRPKPEKGQLLIVRRSHRKEHPWAYDIDRAQPAAAALRML
ncbi:hypothetical protein B0H19DRAFT_82752 [Mycena capillaripes]|nr:hypothetical protein B0H19DRAFT_82752 [Mycena capillaripes]